MEKQIGGCLVIMAGGIAILVFTALIMVLPVYFLWNWIIPDITNHALTPITFWQALGLTILCSILFKGTTEIKK